LALISAIAIFGHTVATLEPASQRSTTPLVGPSALSAAVLAAVAAYNGWANVAMIGGEVQNPKRNVPWALILGMLIVIGLYFMANLAFLDVLPMSDILTANSTAHPTAPSVASRAAAIVLGPRVGLALPLLFMISAVGTLHCNLLAVPRVFFAMARDGLLPQGLASVSSTARTPIAAITALACVGGALAVLGSYDRLANMAAFGYVLFYALNAAGLLWWQYREPRGYGQILGGFRWIPLLFLVGMLWLFITLIMRGSIEIVTALVLMAAGLPVFGYLRYRRSAL